MSLFASLGHSDIWSISGISFASPLNDILDKESFTLEELLREDELLQEVKSRNSRLIDFLTQEKVVDQILDYIVTTPVDLRKYTMAELKEKLIEKSLSPEGSRWDLAHRLYSALGDESDEGVDLRRYKYPYMSCEILCCEIPQILALFDDNEDGSPSPKLVKLFKVLEYEAPLDLYLAGYFEKIVDMLFRKMTKTMMNFVNLHRTKEQGHLNLVGKFLDHVDNYSTLQILQRLMLPHIPFNMHMMEPETMEAEETAKCDWSQYQSTCDMLVEKMVVNTSTDIPAHVCALIVTVLQISPLDAPFFSNLCHNSCISLLLKAALTEGEYDQNVGNAALYVLAVLVQRLCESLDPEMDIDYGGADAGVFGRSPVLASESMKACISSMAASIEPFIDSFATQLQTYTDSSPAGSVKMQTHEEFARLGSRGLNLVKLVEVLVRLNDKDIDKMLCEKGMLTACVKMMFKYELHSVLHLSVQKIILTVLECGEDRRATQEHLLNESGILESIMSYIAEASATPENGESVGGLRRGPANLGNSRRPVVGHLVAIAEFLMSAHMANESEEDAEENEGEKLDTETQAAVDASDVKKPGDDATLTSTAFGVDELAEDGEGIKSNESSPTKGQQRRQDSALKDIISSSKSGAQWNSFLGQEMQTYIETLQYFSPSKGSDQEGEGHFDVSVPSFQLQDAITAGGGDDSDDDEEYEQQQATSAGGDEGEDLFASFGGTDVHSNGGNNASSAPDTSVETVSDADPFSNGDPFADGGDPFADVVVTNEANEPVQEEPTADPFAGVSSFDLDTLKDVPDSGSHEEESGEATSTQGAPDDDDEVTKEATSSDMMSPPKGKGALGNGKDDIGEAILLSDDGAGEP